MQSKNIYLTVDVECHDFARKNQYIDGLVNNEYWGIKKILELGKREGIPINFFLDVGECKEYGDNFITDIVKLIRAYNQPIFLHLHPDYISGDHSRTFFWMYSHSEKMEILEEALDDYNRLVTHCPLNQLVFRTGRYGIDWDLLSILKELPYDVLDLSYVYDAPKMCHLTYDEIKTMNCAREFDSVTLLPTTRFIGFDFFNKKKCIGFDSSEATLFEFKQILDKTCLQNIVWTMHSWHFIRKFFFLKKLVFKDKAGERKFTKCVRYAKNKGFCFRSLNEFVFTEETDEILNLSTGIRGKMVALLNNFFRFQKIACLNKKYFIFYAMFYVVIFSIFAVIIFTLFTA